MHWKWFVRNDIWKIPVGRCLCCALHGVRKSPDEELQVVCLYKQMLRFDDYAPRYLVGLKHSMKQTCSGYAMYGKKTWELCRFIFMAADILPVQRLCVIFQWSCPIRRRLMPKQWQSKTIYLIMMNFLLPIIVHHQLLHRMFLMIMWFYFHYCASSGKICLSCWIFTDHCSQFFPPTSACGNEELLARRSDLCW